MKKIFTSVMLVSAFAFVGCSGKKTACECMEMAPGMMMKVMTGSMSQEEAEKEMEPCNWMDELSEKERLEAIQDCGGEFANKAKEAIENSTKEAEQASKEMVDELINSLEEAMDEVNESLDSLETEL